MHVRPERNADVLVGSLVVAVGKSSRPARVGLPAEVVDVVLDDVALKQFHGGQCLPRL